MTVAEMYTQMTGRDMPKPFSEKTPEEHARDWERARATINETEDISDEDFDAFLKRAYEAFSNEPAHPASFEDEDAA